MPLLTQNREMRRDGIYNWTLPAWVSELPDGRIVNVCPQAGACASLCYARNGTYRFPSVRAAHARNLARVLDDLGGWTADMLTELGRRKFRPTGVPRLPGLPRAHLHTRVAQLLDTGAACVRVHDSGDFLNAEYLLAWLMIAESVPDILFYCYTKEVRLFKTLAEPHAPANFLWCYSLGGRQDFLVDRDNDRHADVYAGEAAIDRAGYYSQDAHDLLCVLAPSLRIGIPANHIPAFQRRQGDRTFGELEAALVRHGRPA